MTESIVANSCDNAIDFYDVAKILGNHMSQKDLLVDVSSNSYDGEVTNADLWRSVGLELREAREGQAYATIQAFWKEHQNGPTQNTIKQIEAGRILTIATVGAYCVELGVDLPTVLKTVLDRALGGRPALSADALFVGKAFQRGRKKLPHQTASMWKQALAIDAQLVLDPGSAPTQPSVTERKARQRGQ